MRSGLIGLSLVFLLAATTVVADNAPATSPAKISLVLTSEIDSLQQGGIRPGQEVLTNLDAIGEKSFPDGWYAKVYVLGNIGGGFSAKRVGDIQVTSNIDTVPAWRLFEAYVRHTSDDGHLVASFGLMNLNGVFDVQKYAKTFLNPSHGIGPDFSQTGPSIFPTTALGTMVTVIPDQDWRLRLGVFDGVPGDPSHPTVFTRIHLSSKDGAHIIGEVERDFPGGFIKIDHWVDTAKQSRLGDPALLTRNSGSFVQAGFTLHQDHQDLNRALKGWLRLGQANSQLNAQSIYRGGGVIQTGVFFKDDQLGLALAQVHFSQAWRQNHHVGPDETNLEVTYLFNLNDQLSLQPDLQWVFHPSGWPELKTAQVIAVRFVQTLIP